MTGHQLHAVATAPGQSWRCVLVGSEALLIECGRLLVQQGHEIVAIVSRSPDIAAFAATAGARLLPDAAALLAAGDLPPVDYLFSITNLRILPAAALALPRAAAINFHDGPLPEYAGLDTPSWALLDGVTGHGVTWHLMTEEVDAGGVLAQRRFPVAPDETALGLNRKCFVAGLESFEELVAALAAADRIPAPLPGAPCRLFGRGDRPEAAAAVRWDQRAERLDRLVRALDFGGHANPLGAPTARLAGQSLLVEALRVTGAPSRQPPGTIVAADTAGITVATATDDVVLTRLATLAGAPLSLAEAIQRHGLVPGARFDVPTAEQAALIGSIDTGLARHERFWTRRLADRATLDLPYVDRRAASTPTAFVDQPLPASADPARADTVLAAAAAWLARLADTPRFDVGHADPVMRARLDGAAAWFAPQVPLRVDCDFAAPFETLAEAVAAERRELHRHIGYNATLAARVPELRGLAALPVAVLIVDRLDEAAAEPGAELTLALRHDGGVVRWLHDPRSLSRAAVAEMQRQFATLLAAADRDPRRPVADLPLLTDTQLAAQHARNDTAGAWRADACVHQLIAEQVARTPDAAAVTCHDRSLTYRELDACAELQARRLREQGVGPDVLVGLHVERSLELVVAVLAIHKAGGAYVPLDPAYPADRLTHMLADSRAPVLLTQSHLAARLPAVDARVLCLDSVWPVPVDASDAPVDGGATPDNLAYVIYTSGSTGRPKGVSVEHRNVVNFFAGMDERIAAPGKWLAVTSLSFDISVLELCWTLTRGFEVVLYTGEDRQAAAAPHADRKLDFSLFYFAGDAAENVTDKYKLLLEGAKFADRAGFSAVWTPERHFHAFGGLYPNPAVTGAAIAGVTERVQIRAGSCVLPLHHPLRVAEEWSVVDNISNGRVGISFAAGWQPDDFVLAPDRFKGNKDVMLRDIEVVRKLWRGEAVAFPGPLGKDVDTVVLPRPIQPELPFWLTSAGNIETFEAAGRLGANVLTHLLGQTVEELADKLAAYRAAWRAAGHPGEGSAALMLHSFVGADTEQVRAIVREPLIAYLRSSASLIKQYAWSFPAFKRRPGMEEGGAGIELGGLDEAEMAALLDHAFERYYETSGLFGTPASCAAMVERVKAAGVDEIACLIDFGIAADTVLAHLPMLDEVRRAALPRRAASVDSADIPTLIERHGITHLQCTPSMASLLLADERAGAALGRLQAMMVGGEALPPALAAELRRQVGGTLMNMYGPTETTIWSTTSVVGETVTLGTPLRNQEVFVLDTRQRPVPDGVAGELVIGGLGVTRGYLHRPELTAERFVAHPTRPGERVYRTGDLAVWGADGLEFLGRLDNQVKIRGHRIELGEIEAELLAHPAVREAVVVARQAGGDTSLIAYVVPADASPDSMREHLRARLPEAMLPSRIIGLAAMPRTPNGKLDRNALPSPEAAAPPLAIVPALAPASGIEEQIAAVWRGVLKLDQVGANDNFFDLGGHSLLAVQVHRQLRAAFAQSLSITDIFRYPTIATLAARLGSAEEDNSAAQAGESRAQSRLAAMSRRRGAPAPIAAGRTG